MVWCGNILTNDFCRLRIMSPEGVSNGYTSSDSDSDLGFGQFLLLMSLVEYERLHFFKQPCRTSRLTGKKYVIEILNGHDDRCYDSFRMTNVYLFTFVVI